jgi:NhaP-type Na+/H+ and K+/H+ antiporter
LLAPLRFASAQRIDCGHLSRAYPVSSASVELAKHVLMLFGIILAVGTASAVLAQKLKVPDVVVFLVIGTLLGPGVAGVIDIKADSALNQLVLIFGSCYILFDGGASLRLKVLKEVWITIVILATAGVLITAAAARAAWRRQSRRYQPLIASANAPWETGAASGGL